ncbi:MAG: hypothetical protein HYX82_03365 [Chloroflexi bacterium]|nr:hypothetical protein [Chloroflexota bacterium]
MAQSMQNTMAPLGIMNVKTSVMGRVPSNTNVSKKEMDRLVAFARKNIPYNSLYVWNAWINGVVIQLYTNNFHLMDFWIDNWFPARLMGIQPHGVIYAVTGVPEEKPYAYYSSESKTAVFVNTDYYGQCKSWALGIVADIMEMQYNVHSIHAAVVDVGGCGIAIIAPTGTGKSTQSYGLVFHHPQARMHSDDWCYVEYVGGERGRAIAAISERMFYIRTDIVSTYPQMGELFRRCKLENVGETFSSVRNSRAILDPTWIGGTEKFVTGTRIRAVILLRRDKTSPPELELEPEEAIKILRKGEYMVLPGAGPEEEWGKTKSEPFYNPYLLVRSEDRTELQVEFFHRLFRIASCHILNTGVETVEETQRRILRIAREATERLTRLQ